MMDLTLATGFGIVARKALRFLGGLLLCVSPSSLQAGESIAAYLDSSGRVIFTNEPTGARNVPATLPASAATDNSSLRTRSYIDGLIEQAANQHQVDPALVRAIVQVESNYNPNAVSHRGARGLMQLIPGTASRFGVRNSFDPQSNLDGGIRYLKYLMELFDGDLRLSLAAYNAGENVVGRVKGVPPYPETRRYLQKISQIYPLQQTQQRTTRSVPGIMKFVDSKGIVHFTNTDLPRISR